MPNGAKFKVLRARDNQDDDVPNIEVVVQFQANGDIPLPGASFRLSIYDDLPSTCLMRNSAPLNYQNRVLSFQNHIPGSYTAVSTANKSAGNRANQLLAVEDTLCSLGIIDPVTLAST